ncbi:hypothetical protein BJX99DRAFT_236078 [Aspergillus californicus]
MSPSFDTYPLTALDHLIRPVYLGALLTLNLQGKNRTDALDRLEVAANRLVSHLPFLGGYVVPAPPADGNVNAFQVQDCEYGGNAFFVLQEHSILTPLLLNGRLNPDFIPSAPVFQLQEPCPMLQIKANIMADVFYLVYHIHHMDIDGVGASVMSRTLAQLCRDPDTPLHELPTRSDAQKRMRAHLLKLGSSSTPHPLRWQPKPFDFPDFDLTDPRNTTLNRRFPIRGEKLRMI